MEKILYITIFKIELEIHTSDEFVVKYLIKNNFSNHILPRYACNYDCEGDYKPDVVLYIINGSEDSYISYNKSTFYAYYKDIHSDIRHLSYLLLYVIQRSLQKKNYYYMHSASLCIKDKGFILAGESSSGKTSILLKCKSLVDVSIIGDDASIVGKDGNKIVIASGNKAIFYNEKYDDSFLYDGENKKYYTYIKSCSSNVEVSKLIFIFPYCENKCIVNSTQSRRRIYEQLSLDIAGIGYYYLPDYKVYPNLDDIVTAQNRFEFVDDFIKNVDVYEVYGNYKYRENICLKLFMNHNI